MQQDDQARPRSNRFHSRRQKSLAAEEIVPQSASGILLHVRKCARFSDRMGLDRSVLSPDGKLVAGSNNNYVEVIIWNAITGTEIFCTVSSLGMWVD